MIRDFAKNITWLKAWQGDQKVTVNKLDKQTWLCEPVSGPLRIEYEVYAWDLSVRTAHLDQTHAYFNGTSVFLKAHGAEHLPCTVDLVAPEGEQYKAWQVATSLRCADARMYGFGRYQAANYDELIDHPVEMGTFTLASFEACGVQHDIAITGKHAADMDRLCADLKIICEHQIRFFGEPAPVDRYVFQVMVVGEGYGGLEHRASTSLLCSRYDLPRAGEEKINEQYRNFLALCSHEYFHTWNIKRIKPAVFLPYQLEQETHTPLLWMFEGFTSYYDELSLVHCGLINADEYLEMLGQTVTRVIRGNGRFLQSVAESSFDAWTKFYKQDENALNTIVSYYTKGTLIGLMLDLLIRERSDGDFSLDDVMRFLWLEYGQQQKGLHDDTVSRVIEQVCGFSLESEIQQMVYGIDDIDIAGQLAKFAVEYHVRAASSPTDSGGKAAQAGDTAPNSLGARYSADDSGVKLNMVLDSGAAQQAGLSAGDVIIAMDGIKVSADTLQTRLQHFAVGETLEIHAFRRDELMLFELVVQLEPENTCFLTLADASDKPLVRRKQWLHQ